MPSATFLNLPAQKQEKLLCAAVREFTQKPFNEASINRIIKEAGIPRGSFYMYFRDKEELLRYLLRDYVDQLVMVTEELLLRDGGDVFSALMELYDYIAAHRDDQDLGGLGVLGGIVNRNGPLQQKGLLEFLDPRAIIGRLRHAVNPDLLDLRDPGDLDSMLGLLVGLAVPLFCRGLNHGDPGAREQLEQCLRILRRGMGAKPLPQRT